MRKMLSVSLLTIFMFVFTASFAYAAGTITSASVNYSLNQITAKGSGFSTGNPNVVFNGTTLTVVGTPTTTTVTAQLPSGVTQGTYLLTVSNSPAFDVTYGAAGPAGPQGPQGPQGATGATGPQGPAGPSPHYANVAVVAQSGGDYTDPVAAMSGIAAWCGTPSATNPCLVKIMPGVYNMGVSGGRSLIMQQYIDIEGSGEGVTILSGTDTYNGAVYGASNAELRSLTIQSSGTGLPAGSAGVVIEASTPKLTNVTINVTDPTAAVGVNITSSPPVVMNNVTINVSAPYSGTRGIANVSSSTIIRNSTITVSGAYGIGIMSNYTASVDMRDVVVNASSGLWFGEASYAIVRESVIIGTTKSVASGYYSKIAYSQLIGPIDPPLTCIGVYDANFQPIICP